MCPEEGGANGGGSGGEGGGGEGGGHPARRASDMPAHSSARARVGQGQGTCLCAIQTRDIAHATADAAHEGRLAASQQWRKLPLWPEPTGLFEAVLKEWI